ncbi:diguanylate cyclase [Geitlerinema sp. PCC 7407]|uniref:sensor domain-containing diguanylate cyclase n=1 Tax=Geitlerinema sp. PCC 7407 TaxID=1173025 RepID=UPI00029FC2E3|nr:diguanylate cyclase [Geitlerinema sp. PCC 7407]AFY67697.1 diguanylate cyclase with PAS/PAC and GAF sensors [Geitlerinema sp. PCC 7407]
MKTPPVLSSLSPQRSLETVVVGGFGIALLLLGVIGGISEWSVSRLLRTAESLSHQHEVLYELSTLLSQIKDIQVGQRGYVITGDEVFLEPHDLGIKRTYEELEHLRQLLSYDSEHQQELMLLQALIDERVGFSRRVVNARRTQGQKAAEALIASKQGEQNMNQIRFLVGILERKAQQTLAEQTRIAQVNARNTHWVIWVGSGLALALMPTAGLVVYRGIGQRDRIAGALRATEARFRAAVEASPDALFVVETVLDPEGKVADFVLSDLNAKAEQMIGRPRAQALGQPLRRMLPIYEQAESFEQLLQAAQRQVPLQEDFQAAIAPEKVRWLQHQVVPMEDGLAITLRDVSDRKAVEGVLHDSNAELQGWVAQLEQYNEDLTLLNQLSDLLQACITLEEACKVIGQLMPLLLPQFSGGVSLISNSRNIVETVATWGDAIASQPLFGLQECVALRRGQPHLVEHIHQGLICQHLTHPLPGAYFCIPIVAQGDIIGVLHFSAPTTGTFNRTQQQLAVTIARQVSLALANLRLYQSLQRQSIRDPLTGLFNRRYLEESLEREVRRAERKQQTLGVILLDIDHFKRFNDTFGHKAGDTVLREVGAFLQGQIRATDIACRYGGEEFLLILPEASPEDTRQRAEQLREGIKHLNLQQNAEALGAITLSLGVAVFPIHGQSGEAVIQAADTALYKAKAAGRDRVFVAASSHAGL